MHPFEPAVLVLPVCAHPATITQLETLMLEQRLYRIDSQPEPDEHATRSVIRRPWMLRNLVWARAGRIERPDRSAHEPLVAALVTDHLSSLSPDETEQLAIISLFLQHDMRVFVGEEKWTASLYRTRVGEAPDGGAAMLRLVDDLEENLNTYLASSGHDLPPYPQGFMFDTIAKDYDRAVWRAHELAAEPGSTATSVMRRLQLEGYKNKTHRKVQWNRDTARKAMRAPLPEPRPTSEAPASASGRTGGPQ